MTPPSVMLVLAQMLKMAGWAVAMGNGSARVKEVHPGPSGGVRHGMA